MSVVEPSATRTVLLASLLDSSSTEKAAVALRSAGEMAVTRPDGGAALRAWIRDTEPTIIGGRCTVCLAWSEHDRQDLPEVVELGPGGFGSAHHPTTRMLLEELAERIVGGERVLDVGCGSGVLAIVGLRLGAEAAIGVDLKKEAVAAARRNASLNGFADRFEATAEPLTEIHGDFDVVVANIAREGIVSVAAELVACRRDGGWVGVSGITSAQADQVGEFLRPLDEVGSRADGDWASLVFS